MDLKKLELRISWVNDISSSSSFSILNNSLCDGCTYYCELLFVLIAECGQIYGVCVFKLCLLFLHFVPNLTFPNNLADFL